MLSIEGLLPILLLLSIIVAISFLSVKRSYEEYTYADYDKISCCWCPRDINIV